jgi:hypothetical protein
MYHEHPDLIKWNKAFLELAEKHRIVVPTQKDIDEYIEHGMIINIFSESDLLEEFRLEFYDDGNRYQDYNYYKEKLEELNIFLGDLVNISDISEVYSDNDPCVLRLLFTLNGEQENMIIDTNENWDCVPENFVDLLGSILEPHIEAANLYSVGNEWHVSYLKLPPAFLTDLKKLDEQYP